MIDSDHEEFDARQYTHDHDKDQRPADDFDVEDDGEFGNKY